MLPDLSKLRSLEAPPELPDEILRLISEYTTTCLQESTFVLQWVKQANILQAVVIMDRIYNQNMVDMENIKTDLATRLAHAIPQAMPLSIDRLNAEAKNWQLRMDMNASVVTQLPPPHLPLSPLTILVTFTHYGLLHFSGQYGVGRIPNAGEPAHERDDGSAGIHP